MNRRIKYEDFGYYKCYCNYRFVYFRQLDLLRKLFEKVYVTRQVYDEVVEDNGDRVGSIKKFIELMYGRLHKGELSVIVAAKELGINYVLMDDLSARKIVESFSLVPIGIIGILKLAKIKGLIPGIKPFLDKLIDNNFRISLKLYNEILKETNEL